MRTISRAVVWMCTAEWLRNQSLHWLAKQLRAAISKNFLYLGIELSNFSFWICYHNSVGRIFKQGSESRFTFAQGFFCLFSPGNIVIDFQNGYGFVLRITLQDAAAGDDDFFSSFRVWMTSPSQTDTPERGRPLFFRACPRNTGDSPASSVAIAAVYTAVKWTLNFIALFASK